MSKREAILCHKLVVLNTLMMEVFDDLKLDDEFKEEHKKVFQPAMDYIEKSLEQTTIDDELITSRSTYIFDLSKKIDTIMRKNYKKI